MIFAAIDVGSNAVRLLVSEVNENNGDFIAEKTSLVRVPVRLGEDTFNTGSISKEKTDSLVNVFIAFKHLMSVYKPVDYIAVATSALREASNSDSVIKRIKKETSIILNLIDGLKEAEYLSLHEEIPGFYLNIDVGGGSTEATLSLKKEILKLRSFKLGTIRILNGKDKEEDWIEFRKFLNEIREEYGEITLAGSGGNINKLSKLFGEKGAKELSCKQLKQGVSKLRSMSVDQRIFEMGLRHDRADVIVPAGELFISAMELTNSEKVIIPRIGLTDSLIRYLYSRHIQLKKQA